MALAFAPATPADIPAISAFLISRFNAPADAIFARADVLEWKYFAPGPDWEGSRSYVLRDDEGAIRAHCGLLPINLRFEQGEVSCLCFLDWVSERDLPGAGVLLKKKLMRMASTSIVIGGSDDTRAVVPRIGFAPVGEVTTFARVLRPWLQMRNRPPEPAPKRLARWLRNSCWSLKSAGVVESSWSANRVSAFSTLPTKILNSIYPTPNRSASYLNYWLQTPTTAIAGYEVLLRGEPQGYFLLTRVDRQARIADVRVMSDKIEDRANVYRLATVVANEDERVVEVVTIASTQPAREALVRAGFRNRGSSPLFLADSGKRLVQAPPLLLNMIDGDGAYLHDPNHPFVT